MTFSANVFAFVSVWDLFTIVHTQATLTADGVNYLPNVVHSVLPVAVFRLKRHVVPARARAAAPERWVESSHQTSTTLGLRRWTRLPKS